MSRSALRPWVGMSYAHVVLPFPHFDDDLRQRFTAAAEEDGWEVVPDDQANAELDGPVLSYRWRHANGGTVVAVVLCWYPLLLTFGPVGRAGHGNARNRRVIRRLVQVALGQGGREVGDIDLARVIEASKDRWQQALEARRAVEEQRRWLECRECQQCGALSAYGMLHCAGCSRRFAPADDADREERGRKAAEAIEKAERQLDSLARGEGLFQNWPAPQVAQEAVG